MKKKIISVISILACISLVFNLSGCAETAQAENLMDKYEDTPCTVFTSPDDSFYNAETDFGLKLLKNTSEKNKNNLVSPLSAMICLAMVSNGANGETQNQILTALSDETDINRLNGYLGKYIAGGDKDNKALKSANSIWINKDMEYEICDEFLKTDAMYYRSGVYNESFDSSIVDKVNGWVDEHTDSMIEKIADKIDPDTAMILINALAFESKWAEQYAGDTWEQAFTCTDKSTQTADMMSFNENKYFTDDNAVGFIKPYEDGNYSFAVLLPDEDTDIDSYIASLSGEHLRSILNKAQRASVDVTMPKFKSESDLMLNEALKSMGMKDMFSDNADFSSLVKGGGVLADSVMQKTFIEVSESGTKAAAVTAAFTAKSAAPGMVETYTVELNRPFLYMIIDSDSNTPIFIGKLESVE